MSDVALRGVSKAFGPVGVIHGVSLDVPSGEFVVFVGPSGCGKSTLLRLIAGFEDSSEGEVLIGGRPMSGTAARDRGVAMVFQNYALYPHMSVRENLAFGLRNVGLPRAEIAGRVDRAAGILRLGDYLDRRPSQLSGGQRQRVAIGRAIVKEPEVFLFDEPLSNLDAELRVQMRTEIAKLHHRLGATMIYVTHDQTEAMTMADRIVVLRAGRIEQQGAPIELYERPANLFVAGFLGAPKMNLIEARVRPGSLREGDAATLGLRPDNLRLDEGGALAGEVDVVEQLGPVQLVHATLAGGPAVVAEVRGAAAPRVGEAVRLSPGPGLRHVFDGGGQAVTLHDGAGLGEGRA